MAVNVVAKLDVNASMKTRNKIIIIAVLLFVILDLPFFTSITVIHDVIQVSHILHFWSIPIDTQVTGIKPTYHVGEQIKFTVSHYNFGYYQEYPQYEISKENDNMPIINGGMTNDGLHYGPFTVLTIWPGNWQIHEYREDYLVDENGNRVDTKPTEGSWNTVSETKPISLDEPGKYALHVYTMIRNGEISIPFEVIENEN